MTGDSTILQIDPDYAAPMTVRLTSGASRFALDRKVDCSPDELLVEFYDRRYAHEPGFTPYGQFIRCYCAAALLARGDARLLLNDDVPQWAVDPRTLLRVIEWIRAGGATHTGAA